MYENKNQRNCDKEQKNLENIQHYINKSIFFTYITQHKIWLQTKNQQWHRWAQGHIDEEKSFMMVSGEFSRIIVSVVQDCD